MRHKREGWDMRRLNYSTADEFLNDMAEYFSRMARGTEEDKEYWFYSSIEEDCRELAERLETLWTAAAALNIKK